MLHTWLRNPLDLKLLRRVFSNAFPLFRQIVKSGYVFIFNLPRPLANSIGTVGDHWFLRYLNAVSTHPDPPKPLPGTHGAEMLAGSIGPSMKECVSSGKGDLEYPRSVRERAQNGAWFEKIRVYRDGLAFAPWEKSLETLWDLTQIQQVKSRRRSSSGAGLFDTGPEGSLKAPVTVIWGKSDVAIENSIAIEGIRDFFGVKGSQLIMIQKCGHWTPVERQGAPVFEEVIAWAAGGEVGSLKDRLDSDYPMASIITER
jgi:pimeloyl-ACP methyl ester carboxylesterase